MTALILVGAGGHARVLAEVFAARGLAVKGYVTRQPETAKGILTGIEWLGHDDSLLEQGPKDVSLVNGIGSIGDPAQRRALFERFRSQGFNFATVIHPSAIVASNVVVAEGAQIMAGAILQTGVRVGLNTIINTGATIDHDCIIGDHVHVAPGVSLSGGVAIGHGAHVGIGATVIQNVRIGVGAMVAAGAVVIENVAVNARVMGNPARTPVSL